MSGCSGTVSALARQSGYGYEDEVLNAMRTDPLLRDVFLLVNGVRTQANIVAELGVGQATVSRKLDALIEDWDLVRKTTRDKQGTRYVQTSLARDLRIERALRSANTGKNQMSDEIASDSGAEIPRSRREFYI